VAGVTRGLNPFQREGGMLLGTSEYSEQLMRVLALKGDLPQWMDPRYNIGLTVGDFTGPEWSWPRRTSRWSVGGTGVAGAGLFSIFAFAGQNVTGRQTMAIVDSIVVSNPSAATISLGFGVTAGGFGGVAFTRFGQMLDDRQFGAVQSAYAAGVAQNAVSPVPAQAFLFSIPAGGFIQLPVCPFVLTNASNAAGTQNIGWILVPTVVNTGFQVGTTWRERVVADSELT
jgi:hypothetical protein